MDEKITDEQVERLERIRLFTQDCLDMQHVSAGARGNLMCIRDEVDALLTWAFRDRLEAQQAAEANATYWPTDLDSPTCLFCPSCGMRMNPIRERELHNSGCLLRTFMQNSQPTTQPVSPRVAAAEAEGHGAPEVAYSSAHRHSAELAAVIMSREGQDFSEAPSTDPVPEESAPSRPVGVDREEDAKTLQGIMRKAANGYLLDGGDIEEIEDIADRLALSSGDGWRDPNADQPEDQQRCLVLLDPRRFDVPVWIDTWDDFVGSWKENDNSAVVGWQPLPSPPAKTGG